MEAQRYVGARELFVGRLLDEGGASRDFSLLDPEEYLTAARTSSVRHLTQVFARTVFDPPSPWVDPSTVAEAVVEVRPHREVRERPPRPPEGPPGEDPLEAALERAARGRAKRSRRVDILLGSDESAELVGVMRAAGWPGAAQVLVEALAAAADPSLPVTASMTDELLVEPDGPVTYLTPVLLRRASAAVPQQHDDRPAGTPVIARGSGREAVHG